MLKFEIDIIKELSLLREELRTEVKSKLPELNFTTPPSEITEEIKEKLPDGVKVALCGKCIYNDKIKEYQKVNFYPCCECHLSIRVKLEKCRKNEQSNEGEKIPDNCKFNGKSCDIKECPPGHKLVFDYDYDIIIFEDKSIFKNKKEKEIRVIFENLLDNLIDEYNIELFRLSSMYDGTLSWMWNTLKFNTLYRWIRVNDMEDYIERIRMKKTIMCIRMAFKQFEKTNARFDESQRIFNETMNRNRSYTEKEKKSEMDDNSEEKIRDPEERKRFIEEKKRIAMEREEEKRKQKSISEIDQAYITLGFTNIFKLPSQEQVKANYKKLALKLHPDKNTDIDTSKFFRDVSDAYKIICENRGFD